ncbi:MAG: hypothetical protein U9R58_00775 [Chloroflexota bacterium]|nr:hypothetical protein [Chloroflexota bacterium]
MKKEGRLTFIITLSKMIFRAINNKSFRLTHRGSTPNHNLIILIGMQWQDKSKAFTSVFLSLQERADPNAEYHQRSPEHELPGNLLIRQPAR